MRIKRHELTVIALTLAFACFLAGYFTGRRDAVNIVSVPPQTTAETQAPVAAPPQMQNQAAQNEAGGAPANQDTSGVGAASHAPTTQPQLPSENQHASSEVVGAPRGGDGKININTATRSELMDLSGVGEVIAGRIIDYRDRHGPFKSTDEIMNVSGIGERRYEAIKDSITVG